VNRIRLSFWSQFSTARRRALYEAWVGDHAADLYRMAYRLCGDADTAEDLVQETFYHAWKGMSQLREQDKTRAWLYRILRHRYAHWVRDRTRRVRAVSTDHPLEQVVDPGPCALARLSRQDELQAALNELDDSMKTPLLMVFQEGMTCREAAEALDVPLGTVLSRIHRARQKIRSFFETEANAKRAPSADPNNTDPSQQFRLGGGA